MVPLILAGVDLNTFGFRRVFSFTSPCHWRYCPLSPEARPCQCTKSRVHNTIRNQIHLPAALCHHDSNFDTHQRKTFPSAPSLLVHRLHWLVWFGASQDLPFHSQGEKIDGVRVPSRAQVNSPSAMHASQTCEQVERQCQ